MFIYEYMSRHFVMRTLARGSCWDAVCKNWSLKFVLCTKCGTRVCVKISTCIRVGPLVPGPPTGTLGEASSSKKNIAGFAAPRVPWTCMMYQKHLTADCDPNEPFSDLSLHQYTYTTCLYPSPGPTPCVYIYLYTYVCMCVWDIDGLLTYVCISMDAHQSFY